MENPPQHVQALWLRQLAREVDALLFTYRLPMRPAALRLADMPRQWGRYEPDRRCIVLSLQLVLQHDWDIVLEVLKHEMAHQWVHQQGVDAAPHGAAFVAACRRLAVASWAVSASGELPPQLGRPPPPVDAKQAALANKVRKLLALAGSSNEHEAALAMQRVREITRRHALQLAEQPTLPPQVHHLFDRKRRRIDLCEGLIIAILTEYFDVQALYSSQYDAADLQVYKVVEICGSAPQVEFACYVYAFLHDQVAALLRRHPAKWQHRRCGRNSYRRGILDGFAAKLAAQQLAAPAALAAPVAQALVRRNALATQEYVAWRHPRVRRRSWGTGRIAGEPYAAGQADGHALTLHRPMTSGAPQRGRLLPA